MSQIKQLLRLHQQGTGRKRIASFLGISKTTVKSYLQKAGTLPLSTEQLLALDDQELEKKFHPGNPAYKDSRYDHLKSRLDDYARELERTGVNKQVLWEEYRQERPEGYGYSQFCHHLKQHESAARPSMVLHHPPGEKLFIDFAGKKLSYVDRNTGEVIDCQVFVACLPFSDYGFAMAVHTQNVADFTHALVRCLKALEGVPQALVPDNLKSAIVKADRYEPTVNRALEDLANHYGTTVMPARAGKPQDKALVENHVKLIYSRVYAKLRSQLFFSLHDLNEAITEKVRLHNQTRMQQKTYSREEKFLAEEKPLLQPLELKDFELQYYRQLKVAKNNHVLLTCDKHYYSVPYAHIGQKVKVIYTRSMVRIYHDGKQIASHLRSYHKGGYSTAKEHLCSQHNHYKDRSPEYYLQKAGRKSRELHDLMQKIFEQKRYPEQLYRTCDGLLNLQRKTEPAAFQKACQMALEHQAYNYSFIRNVLDNNMTAQQQTIEDQPLPEHDNVRGKDYYQ